MDAFETFIDPDAIPADFEVQPIDPDDATAKDPATCGTCGLTWDDGVSTSWTPAPSGRCPFEYFHVDEEELALERAERRQLGWALARIGSPVTSC